MPKLPLHLVLIILFLVQICSLIALGGYLCHWGNTQAGSRPFAQLSSHQDNPDADWLVVITAPQSSFMVEIHTSTVRLVLCGCLALLSTTAISIVAAHWITRPLVRLKQANQDLGLNLGQPALAEKITISEIQAVTHTFNQATARMRQSFVSVQQQSAEAEEKFITMFRASPDPIAIVTLDAGRFLDVNERMVEFYAYAREELIGRTAGDPGLWARLADVQQCKHMLKTRGRVADMEIATRHKSGATRIVLLSAELCHLHDQEAVLVIMRDMSAHKQAEMALRQSELTFATIFRDSPQPAWTATVAEGRCLDINDSFGKALGYTRNEVVGKTCVELGFWNDIQDLHTFRDAILQTGQIHNFEVVFRTRLGEARAVLLSARVSPLEGQDCIIGVLNDITDRKEVEAALHQSRTQVQEQETFLRSIYEGVAIGIFVVDVTEQGEFLVVALNPAHQQQIGLVELVGKTLSEAQIPAWEAVSQHYQKCIATGSVMSYEESVVLHGQQTYWYTTLTPLKQPDARIYRIIGTTLNITSLKQTETALRQSESRYRILTDISPVAIFRFDERFNCVYVNDRWSEMTGRPKEAAMGRGWMETLHPEERDVLVRQWSAVHAQPASGNLILIQSEGRHLRPDGSINWYYVQVAQEVDATGAITGYIGALTDITTRKQAEAALQQTRQQLEAHIVDLNQRNREMVLLSEMSDLLQACLTIEEACDSLPNLLQPLFPDCSGGIFIISASRDRARLVSTWGQHLYSETEFGLNDCWALRRGRMHVIEQERAGLRCHHIDQQAQIAMTLCIPMIAQGETLGLFYLHTETPAGLPIAQQQLVRTVAEQVALALANLNLRKTLQQQSIRDPLTNLFNRHYLEETLTHEIARAQRHQHAIGVIMLDIDHFKQFNDMYGHDAGDYVLQTVATLLTNKVYGSDIACRYGGEEMILILPEASLEETQQRAEQIRVAIAQFTVSYHGRYLGSLTVSLGVAAFPQHGVTGAAIVQAADGALYRAKAAGRNQVLVAL